MRIETQDDDRDGRRDDDFDRDVRARRQKKSGRGALAAMIVLGLLLVGGGIFALYFYLGGKPAGALGQEMIAYLPADCVVIGSLDLTISSQSGELKEFVVKFLSNDRQGGMDDLNNKLRPAGLTADDFSRAVMGGGLWEKPTIIVRTKKSFDRRKVAELFAATQEITRGETKYFTNGKGTIVFYPSDTLIVVTTERHFEDLQSNGSSKVRVSTELQDIARNMSGRHFWIVVSGHATSKNVNLDQWKGYPYFTPDLIEAVKHMDAAGCWVNIDGDSLKFAVVISCANSEAAEKAATATRNEITARHETDLLNDPEIVDHFKFASKPIRSLFTGLQKSLAVERHDAVLEIAAEVSVSGIEAAIKLLMSGRPPEKVR